MKKTITVILCLTMLLMALIVPFSVSATETWTDIEEYFVGGIAHDFDGVTGKFHKYQGSITNAVIPTNVKTFAQMYGGLSKGYVYTITQEYTMSVQPNGTTDTIIDNTNPVFLTVGLKDFDYASLTDTFSANTYRSNGSHDDNQTEDPTDKFKCNGYMSWRNNRAFVKFIVEPLDDYYFIEHYFGLGCSFNDGIKSSIGTVVLNNMSIEATKAVTSDTYYQEQLAAMQSLENEVQTQGQATVSSIDQNGEQTRQTINQTKDAIVNEMEQAPQKEHDYVEQNKGDSGQVESLLPEVPLDDTKSFISDLFAVLSTTETQTTLTIPDGNVPFFNGVKLWEGQVVDFSPWLNNELIQTLISWWKGIFSIGMTFAIVWNVYSLVLVALGIKKPSADNQFAGDHGSDTEYQRMKERGLK